MLQKLFLFPTRGVDVMSCAFERCEEERERGGIIVDEWVKGKITREGKNALLAE
jgi:hypothetical protein